MVRQSDSMKGNIVVGLLVMMAVVAGAVFLGGDDGALVITQPTAPGEPAELTIAPSACDPQATAQPELRYALRNTENASEEYNAIVTYVYEGTFSKTNLPTEDNYVGSFTTLTTGLPGQGSGFKLVNCYADYTILVPASDGATTSALFHMSVDRNDNSLIVSVPEQTTLIARVRDNDAEAFVYESTEATAGSYFATGASWYSETGNATGDSDGLTVGTDGYFDYTISFLTNATLTTSAIFNDKETAVAIDRQSSAHWDEVSTLKLDGVDLIGNKFASLPTRMAKSNYDEAYLIPGNPEIKTSVNKLDIRGQALDATNPSDDIVVAFYTAGYSISTDDKGVHYGYAQNDAAETVLYTPYVMTLVMG